MDAGERQLYLKTKFDLDEVFNYDDFSLVRRGQRYGIIWRIWGDGALMLRNLDTSRGQNVCNASEVTPFLFQTDGEFKAGARKCINDRLAAYRNQSLDQAPPFYSFLYRSIGVLEAME